MALPNLVSSNPAVVLTYVQKSLDGTFLAVLTNGTAYTASTVVSGTRPFRDVCERRSPVAGTVGVRLCNNRTAYPPHYALPRVVVPPAGILILELGGTP